MMPIHIKRETLALTLAAAIIPCTGFGYKDSAPNPESNGLLGDASFSGSNGWTMARYNHWDGDRPYFKWSEGLNGYTGNWDVVDGSKTTAVTGTYLLTEYYWNSYYTQGKSHMEPQEAGNNAYARIW